MTEQELEVVRKRYVDLFGSEGAQPGQLQEVEARLSLELPVELAEIASFFSGGLLGGISHYAIELNSTATNVVEETIRLRETVSLPHDMIVLAEPPESIVVIKVIRSPMVYSPVIWCDDFDIVNLGNVDSLRNPEIWPDYYSFFSHLLDLEEEERQEG